jgi:hypothetical protein
MNDDAFSDDEADEHNEGAVDIGIPHDEIVELAGTQIDQHYGHRFTVAVSPESEDGNDGEDGDVNSQVTAVMARSSDSYSSQVGLAINQPSWDPSQFNHIFPTRKGVRHIRNRANRAERDKDEQTRLAVDRFMNDWQENACAMDTNSTLAVGRPQEDEHHDSIVANEMDIVHIAQYYENIYGMRGAETIGCNIEKIDGDNFDGQACRINEGMVLAMDSADDSMMEIGNSTSEKDLSDMTAQMQEGFKLSRKQLKRQRDRLNQKTRKTTGDK